jgi:hypothetical protein
MLSAKQEEAMPKRLRLIVYKEDPFNYRYIVHGANPSLRGHFRTVMPFTGESEIAAIKDTLRASSRRLEPFIANLKVIDDA